MWQKYAVSYKTYNFSNTIIISIFKLLPYCFQGLSVFFLHFSEIMLTSIKWIAAKTAYDSWANLHITESNGTRRIRLQRA